MKQISLLKALWYHLYPGILLTAFFIGITPLFHTKGIPPQLIILLGIPIIIVPVMYLHLSRARKMEHKDKITHLITYRNALPNLKFTGYVSGLIVFAFIVYGLTQPVNAWITENFLNWLPEWYKVQDFGGYPRNIIILTLVLNLILNGFVAPVIEELYFRGYLLPRMENLGNAAPFFSTIFFSIYHFWQPQIYLTLMVALLPMTYLTWKTKSIKLAVYTHCGLNLVGALLSFGLLN